MSSGARHGIGIRPPEEARAARGGPETTRAIVRPMWRSGNARIAVMAFRPIALAFRRTAGARVARRAS
jgi:hypothetical protein